MEIDATLTEAITNIVFNMLADVHTALPARVVSYDHTKRKASCKPLIKKAYRDGTNIELPIINNVPVAWLGTSKGMVHFPLEKDDGVLLIFSERPLDTWLSTDTEEPPPDGRKFDLTDAIAIPGLFSFKGDSLADNNDDAIVKYLDSEVRLKKSGDIIVNCPTGKNIKLGAGTVEKLVNEQFKNLFENHKHLIKTAGTAIAQTGVSSSPAALLGTGGIKVPAVAPDPLTFAFNDDITAAQLTVKTKAE